jgi:hypothetical protein
MPKGGEKSIPKGWVETTLGEVINSANTGLERLGFLN